VPKDPDFGLRSSRYFVPEGFTVRRFGKFEAVLQALSESSKRRLLMGNSNLLRESM